MKHALESRVCPRARHDAVEQEPSRTRTSTRTDACLHVRMVHAFLTGRRRSHGLVVLRRAGRFTGLGAGKF